MAGNSTIEPTTGDQGHEHFSPLILIPTGFLCVAGAFGNTLIILAVTLYPNLRSSTNFLLLSLAFTDLAVCLWVMPGAIYDMIPTRRGTLGKIVCNAWISADTTMSCASIWHLCAISFDRFTALEWPIWYRKRGTIPMTGSLIFASWFIALFSTVTLLFGSGGFYLEEEMACGVNVSMVLYVIAPLVGFVLPAAILITLYFKITYSLYYYVRRRSERNERVTPLGASDHSGNGKSVRRGNASSKPSRWCPPNASTSTRTPRIEIRVVVEKDPSNIPPATKQETKPRRIAMFTKSNISRTSVEDSGNVSGTSGEGIGNSTNDGDGKSRLRVPIMPHQHLEELRALERLQTTRSVPAASRTGPPVPLQRSCSLGLQNRERRATLIILIVVTTFFLCWGPFFVITTLVSLTPTPSPALERLGVYSSWLAYGNSVLNPVIYTIFNTSFRLAFKKMLTINQRRVGVMIRY